MKISVPATALMLILFSAACESAQSPETDSRADDSSTISVTGVLHSANSRFFGPPQILGIWQYTIAFMVPDGTWVTDGDPILKFDTEELEFKIRDKQSTLNQKRKELQKHEVLMGEVLSDSRLAVEEARAAVDKAALKADIPDTLLARQDYRKNRLELKQARLTLALKSALLEKQTQLQEIETAIFEREIATLQAEITQLTQSVNSMSFNAPMDGVVIHVLNRRGDKQAVGDNVWGGRRVLEFPDLSQLELHLEIPERESLRVAEGQTVSFTLDAAPDRPFEGRLVALESVIHTRSINQAAKVLDAIVQLDDADPELMRPGMGVNAEIHLAPHEEQGP